MLCPPTPKNKREMRGAEDTKRKHSYIDKWIILIEFGDITINTFK